MSPGPVIAIGTLGVIITPIKDDPLLVAQLELYDLQQGTSGSREVLQCVRVSASQLLQLFRGLRPALNSPSLQYRFLEALRVAYRQDQLRKPLPSLPGLTPFARRCVEALPLKLRSDRVYLLEHFVTLLSDAPSLTRHSQNHRLQLEHPVSNGPGEFDLFYEGKPTGLVSVPVLFTDSLIEGFVEGTPESIVLWAYHRDEIKSDLCDVLEATGLLVAVFENGDMQVRSDPLRDGAELTLIYSPRVDYPTLCRFCSEVGPELIQFAQLHREAVICGEIPELPVELYKRVSQFVPVLDH